MCSIYQYISYAKPTYVIYKKQITFSTLKALLIPIDLKQALFVDLLCVSLLYKERGPISTLGITLQTLIFR